jgi:hypothetical protein
MCRRNTANGFAGSKAAAHHAAMADSKKTHRTDDELDVALKGTFPASDPVSPPSHVEEEKERRRKVLEEDAAKKGRRSAEVRTDSPGRTLISMDTRKGSHTEDALDEALRETFPASDPVSVDATVHEDEVRRRKAKTTRKKRAAKRQQKTPRRSARPTGKRTGQKKTGSKKRKSLRGAPDARRKKAPRKKSARRKTRA